MNYNIAPSLSLPHSRFCFESETAREKERLEQERKRGWTGVKEKEGNGAREKERLERERKRGWSEREREVGVRKK